MAPNHKTKSGEVPTPDVVWQSAVINNTFSEREKAKESDFLLVGEEREQALAEVEARIEAQSEILTELNAKLKDRENLFGVRGSHADIAIFPFGRLFANTDRTWFDSLDVPHLQAWLERHLESDRFKQIMPKFAQWKTGDDEPLFPSAQS